MSALTDGKFEKNNITYYKFKQNIPVPSYLIAFACGNLVSKSISNRIKIYSEPENINDCYNEFCETEQYLTTAEKTFGEYVWGEYNLLVLPSAFPYGGMENTTLTFLTPTLLAGDKSLTNVCAHEIMRKNIIYFIKYIF